MQTGVSDRGYIASFYACDLIIHVYTGGIFLIALVEVYMGATQVTWQLVGAVLLACTGMVVHVMNPPAKLKSEAPSTSEAAAGQTKKDL